MSKEQPKAPLIPNDQTFSGSGAGAPPLAQKPAGFSKTKEKIVLNKSDLDASGLQPNSADKDNKGGKKGGGRALKGAQASAVLNSPAPASAPDANAGKAPEKAKNKSKKPAGKVAGARNAPKTIPTLKSASSNASASAPSTTPEKQKLEAVKKEEPKKEVEREQSPEEKRALAFGKYFREGKTTKGYELLERINGMPHSDELLEVMPFAELEKFSADLFLKVVYFFRDFEEAKDQNKSSGELLKLGSEFVAKEQIPSGCQGIIHNIVQTDIIAKLKADLLAKNHPVSASTTTASTASASAPAMPPAPVSTIPMPASSASAPEITKGISVGSGSSPLAGGVILFYRRDTSARIIYDDSRGDSFDHIGTGRRSIGRIAFVRTCDGEHGSSTSKIFQQTVRVLETSFVRYTSDDRENGRSRSRFDFFHRSRTRRRCSSRIKSSYRDSESKNDASYAR